MKVCCNNCGWEGEEEEDLHDNLSQFIGTEHHYKHPLSAYVYTDGVQYLAEKGAAYWLIDKILITTRYKKKLQEWGTWVLHVNPDKTALLECGDGNGNSLHKEKLDYTTFPLEKAELWFQNGVLFLPSEY